MKKKQYKINLKMKTILTDCAVNTKWKISHVWILTQHRDTELIAQS